MSADGLDREEGSHEQYFGEEGDADVCDTGEYLGEAGDNRSE